MNATLIALVVALPMMSAPLPQVSAEAYVHNRMIPAVVIARVTPAALFAIGSVTKVFTGLLLADAVARREVAYTTTLGELLPDLQLVPEVARMPREDMFRL